MSSTAVVRNVFNVGELRAEFTRIRDARVKVVQTEPLPKDSKCLSDSCPNQASALEIVKSLGILSEHFKDDRQYVSVPGPLRELEQSSNSKPFYAYYAENKCQSLTEEKFKALPMAELLHAKI